MDIPGKSVEDYSARDVTTVRILAAVERLLEQTSYDRLSVVDICKEAGVSRQTFYQHFKDKYDIAEWLWSQHSSRMLTNPQHVSCWKESVMDMLSAFCDNENIVIGSLQSRDYNNLLRYGRIHRKAFLLSEAEKRLSAGVPEEVTFAIDFFVNAESHALSEWMQGDRSVPMERLAEFVEQCVPSVLRVLFDGEEKAGFAGGDTEPAIAK